MAERLSRKEIVEIARLYVREQLSSTEISQRMDCSTATILSVLRRLGIPRRTMEETARIRNEKLREEVAAVLSDVAIPKVPSTYTANVDGMTTVRASL